MLKTVEGLRDKGVPVISQRDGFDLSTPMGKLMLTMLAGVAELERENIRERQRIGLQRTKAAPLAVRARLVPPRWRSGGASMRRRSAKPPRTSGWGYRQSSGLASSTRSSSCQY